MSEWIEWNGGECPAEPDTRVLLKFRDGVGDLRFPWPAGYWARGNTGYGSDIIAYRIAEDGSND